MYAFLLAIHVFVCFFLVAVILLQAGKGGGMSETLGGSVTQSILGTRSTAFMTKLTAVCASLFLLTCLSLAFLSAQKRASLFRGYHPPPSSAVQNPSAPAPAAVPPSPPVSPEPQEAAPLPQTP